MLMESFAQRHHVHSEVITFGNLKNENVFVGTVCTTKDHRSLKASLIPYFMGPS